MHSVLVIDDHDIVRIGLETLLLQLPQLRVVGSVANLRDGLAAIQRMLPDLVISDMGLGDSAGLDTVLALVEAQQDRHLLVVSMQEETLYGEQALALGADGYLMKDCVQPHLLPAVLAILAGGTWVSPALNARLMNRHLRRNAAARRTATEGGEPALSLRELQVLQLLRSGKTTKQIAATLHLSARTVDVHRAKLKKKLGLRSGAELIAFASSRL